jgi:hypothetical protein
MDARAERQWQYSWRQARAARVFRPVPRENCSESRIGSGHKPLFRSVCYSAFVRAALQTSRPARHSASRYQQHGGYGPGDSAIADQMHRHTCTCGPDTKVNIPQKAVLPYFPADCLMQASDKFCCLKTAVECCFAHMATAHHHRGWRQHL